MDKITKKFAVVGHPISHSLSPKIHNHFAKQFGIQIEYQRIDVDGRNFKKTLNELKEAGYLGLNVTLPLKNLAWEVCEELSLRSQQTKSVNTISIKNGKFFGETTDGLGLIADLNLKGVALKNKKILVIGAGGASNGVMYDLISQCPEIISLTNRTISKSHDMREYWLEFAKEKKVTINVLGADQHIIFDLIINATSSSLDGGQAVLPKNLNGSFWYDMMYGQQTPFLIEAEKNKAKFSDGLGMLVEQAAAAFEIWHKLKPDTQPTYETL